MDREHSFPASWMEERPFHDPQDGLNGMIYHAQSSIMRWFA
jgi:hypothetical protein